MGLVESHRSVDCANRFYRRICERRSWAIEKMIKAATPFLGLEFSQRDWHRRRRLLPHHPVSLLHICHRFP